MPRPPSKSHDAKAQPQAGGPPSPQPRFVSDLDTLIRARYPLIYLVSWEEQRVENIVAQVAKSHGKQLFHWSITKGLKRIGGGRAVTPAEGSKDPIEALNAIERLSEPSVVLLKDFHPFLADPTCIRALRDLAHTLKTSYTTVIILSPTLTIPTELEKEISVLDVPLPTFRELAQLLGEIVGVVRQSGRAAIEITRADAEKLVKATLGLTLAEAENAFAKAIATDSRLTGDDVSLLLEEKRQVIRKSGLLEYYPADETLGSVGGLENLKTWLTNRTAAFTDAARRFGLPEPKGVLLLGVQGCGKSLTAKSIAATWNLPLLRLDLGRIFSGLVGSSEENLRRAIRVAEGVAPAVLWIDEIEKGMAGMSGPSHGDSGVSARVFGTLLTWLQEKSAPVFVVATANRIEALPPELLRKGRFDEIFFIDLPEQAEREEILRIHLERRKRDPSSFDVPALARLASGFSGAELEQAVIAGLYQAFAEGVDLAQRHIEVAIQETFPLSTTMSDEIGRLRSWARQRTRPASAQRLDPLEHAVQERFG